MLAAALGCAGEPLAAYARLVTTSTAIATNNTMISSRSKNKIDDLLCIRR